MYNGGYQALAAAIVLQAVKDYIQLTRIYKQLVDKKAINPRIQEERQELKQFFNSNYCDFLVGSKNPEILQKIDNATIEELDIIETNIKEGWNDAMRNM